MVYNLVLGTGVPVRVVESGSMCVPYDGACNGWSHPFAQTLHIGDIIVIQKVNPADLNTNYPNSDIIVYENPTNPTSTPIVHRIVAVNKINGTLYFQTKGDGNGDQWPTPVSTLAIRLQHTLERRTRRSPKPRDRQSSYAHSIVWMGNLVLKEQFMGLASDSWPNTVACNS